MAGSRCSCGGPALDITADFEAVGRGACACARWAWSHEQLHEGAKVGADGKKHHPGCAKDKPQRLIVEYPGGVRRELRGAPLRDLLALAVSTRPAG